MQQQEHVLMDSILQQAKLYKLGKFLISMKSMAGNLQSYIQLLEFTCYC